MNRTLIVYAPNINNGGGLILLRQIFNKFSNSLISHVFLDSRIAKKNTNDFLLQANFVEPNLLQRIILEFKLSLVAKASHIVLCFGNIPPLFRLRGHVIVYLQNRYLVDFVSLKGHTFRARLRITAERKLLTFLQSHADEFIVQTISMKILLEKTLKKKVPIKIMPFNSLDFNISAPSSSVDKYDFIYVASGEPHKNHYNLLEAWCLLAEEGHFPSLCLTVSDKKFPLLFTKIQSLKDSYGLAITNLGELSHSEVMQLYKNSSALIFPSLLESYGLPLIEAYYSDIPIIAAELDYVRDVISPDISFDPNSSLSISRAVKRFLSLKTLDTSKLDFLDYLTSQFK
jgi:glycosyltransferase involved in cell wall biosynthesis